MRRLLQSANASNSSANVPGSAYACVSKQEYLAAATNPASYQYAGTPNFFCDGYVDYPAACNLNDNQTSCNNAFAMAMFQNFQRVLGVYSCKQYSQLWTCSDCAAAYKRWLCSQVYRKYFVPDTAYYEEGVFPEDSLNCKCNDAESEMCRRYCQAMPYNCSRPSTVWSCAQTACGSSPGACRGNAILDSNASATPHFYRGAIIEVVSGKGAGQWAKIEEYYPFLHPATGKARQNSSGIAFFTAWRPPYPGVNSELVTEVEGAMYRIYLEDNQRGSCRLATRPRVRRGSPCHLRKSFQPMKPLFDMDQIQNTAAAQQASLTRMSAFSKDSAYCGEDRECVTVDAAVSPSGFLCCPTSGITTNAATGPDGQEFFISYLNISDPKKPLCGVVTGVNDTVASAKVGVADSVSTIAALPALKASDASGCAPKFVPTKDLALDYCVLKTCQAVCFDVNRRCPTDLQFSCPTLRDRREYDSTLCNMMVSHGTSPPPSSPSLSPFLPPTQQASQPLTPPSLPRSSPSLAQ